MFLTLIFGKDWEVPVPRCLLKTGSFTKTTINIPAPPQKKMNQIVLFDKHMSGQFAAGGRLQKRYH